VQVFGPAAVEGSGLIVRQFEDHPPNWPVPAGAVKVTMVPLGYVASQTELPRPAAVEPGPQWITFFVPVAESAVISHEVVFKPALKTVSVDKSDGAMVSPLHEPGLGGAASRLARISGQLNATGGL
jgi:hypothetical protein